MAIRATCQSVHDDNLREDWRGGSKFAPPHSSCLAAHRAYRTWRTDLGHSGSAAPMAAKQAVLPLLGGTWQSALWYHGSVDRLLPETGWHEAPLLSV